MENEKLPPIRPELQLIGRRHDPSGEEIGIVYDPVRHRFFELGPLAIEIITRWNHSPKALLTDINTTTPFYADQEDLRDMLRFLSVNELLRRKPALPRLSGFALVEKTVGHMFFFRVPLVHPDRVIAGLAEILRPILHPASLIILAAIAGTGLTLVARQWDLFARSFNTVFNAGGAFTAMIALILGKAIHELGHALAAKRMGCAVPAMGVAVMFGAPLLYTDLSDTWRLDRRQDRLLVASGGIIAETVLAAIATWGWLVLPEGPTRSACFFLSTTAWAATLAVNANPFMRFDGYFMLSDILGVPNLQDRAFAIGRWALRRALWGTTEPCPDVAPSRLIVMLLTYAWITWTVRGGIFIGLAFAVFHILPKVAAVPLLVSELWVLVFRPIVKELMVWWKNRKDLLGSPHGRVTSILVAFLVLWALVPQSFRLALPAVYAPATRIWVHPPRPALLVRWLPEGTIFNAGDLVAEFRDPELDHQMTASELRLHTLQSVEKQLETSMASAPEIAAQRQRIAAEEATLSGLVAQRDALRIKAATAGRVVESAPDLYPGSWRMPTDPLFLMISVETRSLTAFVNDRDLDLVRLGAAATFYPMPIDFPPFPAEISGIETVPAETIAEPLLASINGGPIATERDTLGRIVPQQGEYRLTVTPLAPTDRTTAAAIEGNLIVQTRPYSIVGMLVRRIWAVSVRETGA